MNIEPEGRLFEICDPWRSSHGAWRLALKIQAVTGIFTSYIHALGGSEPPPHLLCEEVLGALRKALEAALRRRGLWSSPPRYLGVFGDSWYDPHAMEELLLDTYQEIFVRRLRSLANQLRVAESIDGTVVVAIEHFLHDRQKDQDPLGRRVFQVAHRAVEKLVESGRLRVLAGSAELRNNTVLAFPAGGPDQVPVVVAELRSQISALSGVLPDLVGAWHVEPVAKALALQLDGFEEEGIMVFRLGDLFDGLKQSARVFLVEEIASGEDLVPEAVEGSDGLTRLIAKIDPDSAWEEAQSFRRLTRCVVEGIDRAAAKPKMRKDLYRYWKLMCFWAVEVPVCTSATGEAVDLGERELSDVRVGKLLGIGRARVAKWQKILAELILACGGVGGKT